MKNITHIIYDLDGLLLDTEIFYTEATQKIVERFGKTYDWFLKSQLIGKTAKDSANLLIQTLNLPLTPEDYLSECNQILAELFPFAAPLPGAKRLSTHFLSHGIPQAVASSSPRELFEIKTSNHQQWFSSFDCIVLGDDPDIKKGKPSPEIFLTAAKRLNGLPQQCLVFEDAPAGIAAALAAEMPVIAVPDVHIDRALFQKAHKTLNSLEEFDPQFWGLPPFP